MSDEKVTGNSTVAAARKMSDVTVWSRRRLGEPSPAMVFLVTL